MSRPFVFPSLKITHTLGDRELLRISLHHRPGLHEHMERSHSRDAGVPGIHSAEHESHPGLQGGSLLTQMAPAYFQEGSEGQCETSVHSAAPFFPQALESKAGNVGQVLTQCSVGQHLIQVRRTGKSRVLFVELAIKCICLNSTGGNTSFLLSLF